MVGKHVAGSVNIKSKNKDKHKTTPEVFDDSLSSVAPLLEPEPADVLGHLLHSRMPTNPEQAKAKDLNFEKLILFIT